MGASFYCAVPCMLAVRLEFEFFRRYGEEDGAFFGYEIDCQ
jgi:hypothetical protein